MISTSTTAMRLVRVARGMRIIDVSLMIGLRENQLSRMETGNIAISADELDALASVYGVPILVLRGREPLVLDAREPMVRD